MLRNMATSIILYEKVKTTRAKGRRIKAVVERLISQSKKQTQVLALRSLNSMLKDENASKKMIEVLVKRYEKRSSGFLRLIPLGFRAGDAAEMVQLELV